MGFPAKLNSFMLFNDGESYVGETVSITPPKLTRKLEDYRSGGMDRAVKVDMGGEPLEMEVTYGGFMRGLLRQQGMTGFAGVSQRFVGSFLDEDTGVPMSVEVVTRGRHEEIDLGEWKPGEDTEFKVKSQLSYFKLTVDGVTEIEIDVLGMIEIVGGVDRMAERRSLFGLF